MNPRLGDKLQCTLHCSLLQRKARKLGMDTVNDAIALAADRGCFHYNVNTESNAPEISHSQISNTELVILLLLNQQTYSPTAIRCAAQLAGSPDVTADRLAMAARMERVERQLAHIAHAGAEHDPEGREFWQEILERIGPVQSRREEQLPHWSRFVSSPGFHRGKTLAPTWLRPAAP